MILRNLFLFLILFAYQFYYAYPFNVSPQRIHYSDSVIAGKVVSITDGDTFKLLLSDKTVLKIRIASIDCPERKQPFSTRAKQFTSRAIFDKNVKVVVESKDRYGRYIAKVKYGNKDLGEELLRHGMAWHFVRYSTDKNLQKIEDWARSRKISLWAEQAVPPWEWRKGIRMPAAVSD